MPRQPKQSKTRPPSMTDVARRAGVSQTTVSFVLNNVEHANIPEETQDRIWAAIKELGYRPNALARGLRLQRSHLIGLISDEVATTPFAGQIIQGAQDAAWDSKKMLLVINTARRTEIETAAVEMLLEQQVEGIIYTTMYHRPVTPPPALTQVPAVLLDCYTQDRSLPSVVPDEVQGGRAATEVLLRKGHRRIGFINDSETIPATVGRFEGYKQALAAYGIPFDNTLVHVFADMVTGGYEGALALMRLPEPPTAIFCYNDRTAMGVYDALKTLRLSIPQDVAVVGFDNMELLATYLRPQLSTFELPHYLMGQWAVQYLVEHVGRMPDHAPPQHTITCPYIERSSV